MSTWDDMAAFRERHRDWVDAAGAPVTDWLVDALGVRNGETVLDLAAGPGSVGFALMERAGPGVRLITSDVSPATLEVARRAAAVRGLRGVEFRVIDAQAMALESASVDAVVCRWGYMLMSDPLTALHETRRVLRPYGRVAFSVWSDPDRNPWTTIDAVVCASLGYEEPAEPADPGQMFSLADAQTLRITVQASGLALRRLEPVAVSWSYESPEHYVGVEVDRPGERGDFFRALPASERTRAVRLAQELLEPFRTGAGYVVPGETLNVLASRR